MFSSAQGDRNDNGVAKTRSAIIIFILLATLGCAGAPDPGLDDAPTPEPPRRIVSMTPSLTEILFALDLGDRVVGVTTYCDYPAQARERAKIGGFVNPSVEAILALEPDLVLVSPAAGNRDAGMALRRVGVRLEVVPAETLDDAMDAVRRVAGLCGVEQRGADLERSIMERISGVSARVAGRQPVRVLFCLQLDPLMAAGRGTLPAELVELAGGLNVVEAERYPRLGIETVLDQAPEIILQARMDTPDPMTDPIAIDYWRRWPSIPAVRDSRVMVIDGTTALRAGPRVADAVENLARMIHPEAFADPSEGRS